MKTRTQYSVLNSSVSTSIYLVKMLLGFILRSFFIQYLGVEYLGLNGLFTNILSFLSLAELGIGTTIVYELYRPLADNNKEEVKSLMALYKKVYVSIGIFIGVIGLLIIPLIPFMIKNGTNVTGVNTIYVLFLTNSVISYFFTYKRSLINADQKNYVTVLSDFAFYLLTSIFQIVVLMVWHNYFMFLTIQIIGTLISNIVISSIADRRYPYLKDPVKNKIQPEIMLRLKKNVIGNISSQIGGILVMGSDNIIISGFVGLAVVGLYSNYTIVTNALRSLAGQVTNSVVSSIGNLVALGDNKRSYDIFKIHLFISKSIAFFAGIGIFVFINPFVTVWLGKKYLLPESSIFLIAIYAVIFIYQGTPRTFINSFGLYWQQRWKSIIESIVNITVSIALIQLFDLGLNGVLIGTLTSSITVIMWFEPYVVYKYGIEQPLKPYFVDMAIFYALLVVAMIGVGWIGKLFVVTDIWSFITWFVIGMIIIIILYLILFSRKPEFKQVIRKVRSVINR